jgi:hypothetical protein
MLEDAMSSRAVRGVVFSRKDLKGDHGQLAARIVRRAMERTMQRAWRWTAVAGQSSLEQAFFLPAHWGRTECDMGRTPQSEQATTEMVTKACKAFRKHLKSKATCLTCGAADHIESDCSPFFQQLATQRKLRAIASLSSSSRGVALRTEGSAQRPLGSAGKKIRKKK